MEVFGTFIELLGYMLVLAITLLGLVMVLYGVYSFTEPKFVRSVRHFCLIAGGILLVIAYFLYPL